ncbi:N-acetylglucosamine-6-phosphate deacetylase [Rhodosalinus sp. 5P4]|uniref:N-acetylglucosamine-6-phosphate deacetylase n=1 Tax=Rhodosalinus sp. 5P4 TaxID=3239196 RepID=UPI003525F96D
MTGAEVFDGTRTRRGHAVLLEDGDIAAVLPESDLPRQVAVERLAGGLLAPGFVDLQVNGGGGVMLGEALSADAVAGIARAHARLGATTILPTLVSDTPEATRAAISAVAGAGWPGVAGLHLEGPHLARPGAHDPARLRPMTQDDLDLYLDAARRLSLLMLTVAPEAVTPAQVAALARAGVLVSLGHTDAPAEACAALFAAGARAVTHLFNAMSQLTARAPGLVGAALEAGTVDAGLIADGVHVDPSAIRVALRAKAGPGRLFLVTDAMAAAGTDAARFRLGGREIRRAGGRLTLEDGTLAGADLDMAGALSVMTGPVGLDRDSALAMATSIPARVAGLRAGRLAPGLRADMVLLDEALSLARVWQGGAEIRAG